MPTLPTWLAPTTTPATWTTSPLPDEVRIGRPGVARRALGDFARLLAEMLADEATATGPGLLQPLDARAKVLGLIGLIVVVTCVQALPTLTLAYGLCLGLALLSRVPARRLARVWLMVPLFSAAMMLPATLNIVTPGRPLLGLWPGVAVTDVGLLVALRFVLRVATCVTLALLLTATTRPAALFRGLRALGVPAIFITLLAMMQRYLAVLVRAAEELHLARLSRSIVPGSTRQEQAWVAAGIGALFRRAHALGEDIYLAMLSRGYTGEVYLLDEPRWRGKDWAFLAGALLAGALLFLLR